jgi:hypothetical protein
MDEKLFIAFAKFEEGQREVHVDYCHGGFLTHNSAYFVIFSVFSLIVLAENLCTECSYCSHIILPYVEWYTTFILNLSSISASILYSIRELGFHGIALFACICTCRVT